jgi:hypothetical protein
VAHVEECSVLAAWRAAAMVVAQQDRAARGRRDALLGSTCNGVTHVGCAAWGFRALVRDRSGNLCAERRRAASACASESRGAAQCADMPGSASRRRPGPKPDDCCALFACYTPSLSAEMHLESRR